ncbi:MAG: hypothetical protein Q7J07_05665 [Pelolinea sp.]|nr:hypothetical protein [Pelolinea sp.]
MSNFQHRKKCISLVILGLFISTMLMSCTGKQSEPETTQAVIPTPTNIPTLAPARAILVAPAESSPIELADAHALVAELATGSGLEFEVRQEIFANEITLDVRIIVFLEQPNNLGSLAANAPGTQFVAISAQNWSPPANGTIILKDETHVAFMSGYLSAMLAPNFRVGGLLVSENTAFNQAFINGISYYCGLCASVIYPLNRYPFISQQPANSPPANWQAAFNEINANKINVLFLPGDAASAELGTYLGGIDVAVIGDQTPPEELLSRWVATISSDGLSPLREIWDDLLNGQGGKVLNANLKISDINYISLANGLVWLSQGKMDLLSKVIILLREGQIYTGSVIQ